MPIRLCPNRSLPPYSYVPGKYPHPIGDERGHSFGRAEPPCAPPTMDNGRHCEPYLWGFDLFNHGYYWEAHEAWEAVWHACGRSGILAELVQGLIKLAAAGVKAREGAVDGVRRHLLRGAELLERVAEAMAPEVRLLGVEPLALAIKMREMALQSEELMKTSDEPVVILMPMELYPLREDGTNDY